MHMRIHIMWMYEIQEEKTKPSAFPFLQAPDRTREKKKISPEPVILFDLIIMYTILSAIPTSQIGATTATALATNPQFYTVVDFFFLDWLFLLLLLLLLPPFIVHPYIPGELLWMHWYWRRVQDGSWWKSNRQKKRRERKKKKFVFSYFVFFK